MMGNHLNVVFRVFVLNVHFLKYWRPKSLLEKFQVDSLCFKPHQILKNTLLVLFRLALNADIYNV